MRGVITGRAIDTNGKGVEGVHVRLSPTIDSPPYARQTESDRGGSYGFHSVPVGTYRVVLYDATDGAPIGTDREVCVRADQVQHLDLILPQRDD